MESSGVDHYCYVFSSWQQKGKTFRSSGDVGLVRTEVGVEFDLRSQTRCEERDWHRCSGGRASCTHVLAVWRVPFVIDFHGVVGVLDIITENRHPG